MHSPRIRKIKNTIFIFIKGKAFLKSQQMPEKEAVEVDYGAGGFLLAADRLSCSTLLLKLVSSCAVKSPDGPLFCAFWLSKEDSDDRPPLGSGSVYLWYIPPSLLHTLTPPTRHKNPTCGTDSLPPGVTAELL